jgi:hypothetical protein
MHAAADGGRTRPYAQGVPGDRLGLLLDVVDPAQRLDLRVASVGSPDRGVVDMLDRPLPFRAER